MACLNRDRTGSSGANEESSVAQDRMVFDVNVFGLIRMTKAVLTHMRAQESGRVINMSSVGGFAPSPSWPAMSRPQHAVEGYSESVDHEVRERGVRILLVEPFNTSTRLRRERGAGGEPTAGLRAGTADLRSHPGGGDEDRQRPRPQTEAAVHRKAREPAASACSAASSRPGSSTSRSAINRMT
jgi:NAD(P)-dependent dehydrogenase (short-subunit alcohol dehydrogenase family)